MNKRETVCAVVVTYNRKELLLECMRGLLAQTRPLDAIYIIDNASTDGTPELLKEKGYINSAFKEPNISYVRMPENTGGAGGFHEGIKRAYEDGCDWIWVMDDDVKAENDCLSQLMAAVQKYFPGPRVFQCGRKDMKSNESYNNWIKPDYVY